MDSELNLILILFIYLFIYYYFFSKNFKALRTLSSSSTYEDNHESGCVPW